MLFVLVLAVIALAATGCGGPHNPLHSSWHIPPFWNGLWDGFTIVVALIAELFNPHKYGIYSVHHGGGRLYDLGYVLGALIFFNLCFGGGYYYRRSRRPL
jgi:hypothetical protein